MTLLCFVCNSSLEGASNHLVNFVLSCLQEEKIAHPSGMEEMLKDLLGNGEKLKAFSTKRNLAKISICLSEFVSIFFSCNHSFNVSLHKYLY